MQIEKGICLTVNSHQEKKHVIANGVIVNAAQADTYDQQLAQHDEITFTIQSTLPREAKMAQAWEVAKLANVNNSEHDRVFRKFCPILPEECLPCRCNTHYCGKRKHTYSHINA